MNEFTDVHKSILPMILSFADRLNSFARTTLNKELDAHGLKFNQWRLINTIYSKSIFTPAKLADELMIERATVSRYLDQLEANNCIQRTHNQMDRRVVDIKLTTKGEKLAKLGISLMDDAYKEMFSHFSDSEFKQLSTLMEKLSQKVVTATNA
ncbi:MAG: MarR family winged helix-turn-helix transcriptional regulator [Gammaproteobacteria bacterium]